MNSTEILKLSEEIAEKKFMECLFIWIIPLFGICHKVGEIWPLPNRRLPKILFMGSRYLNVGTCIVDILRNWPMHMKYDTRACNILKAISFEFWFFGLNLFTEGVFWLALYALLGNSRKHLAPIVIAFLAVSVPGQVLGWISNVALVSAIPPEQWQSELGYSCNYEVTNERLKGKLSTVLSSLAFASSTCFLITGLFTFVKRYRHLGLSGVRSTGILAMIGREGACYYVLASIFSFLSTLKGVVATGNSTLDDTLTIIIQ
ncbi:hypothetical protein DFP72DRAFT_939169 [Ephemerocybe angulata]|uniref:Uncharacterized protein n=1 Tax=Ephemerocybe angulata TaxID=980116 RepID=A0A8H6LSL4_9AGAR|nr:hypothetical protein DFP72DRAFT_939169 [Tulosesus angulatus]